MYALKSFKFYCFSFSLRFVSSRFVSLRICIVFVSPHTHTHTQTAVQATGGWHVSCFRYGFLVISANAYLMAYAAYEQWASDSIHAPDTLVCQNLNASQSAITHPGNAIAPLCWSPMTDQLSISDLSRCRLYRIICEHIYIYIKIFHQDICHVYFCLCVSSLPAPPCPCSCLTLTFPCEFLHCHRNWAGASRACLHNAKQSTHTHTPSHTHTCSLAGIKVLRFYFTIPYVVLCIANSNFPLTAAKSLLQQKEKQKRKRKRISRSLCSSPAVVVILMLSLRWFVCWFA